MANLLLTGSSLKGLFVKSPCTMHPFKPTQYQKASRGHISVDIQSCVFCRSCEKGCPTHAIQIDRKASTWSIDPFGCIQCGNCALICPEACLTMCNDYTVPSAAMERVVVIRETAGQGGNGDVPDGSQERKAD